MRHLRHFSPELFEQGYALVATQMAGKINPLLARINSHDTQYPRDSHLFSILWFGFLFGPDSLRRTGAVGDDLQRARRRERNGKAATFLVIGNDDLSSGLDTILCGYRHVVELCDEYPPRDGLAGRQLAENDCETDLRLPDRQAPGISRCPVSGTEGNREPPHPFLKEGADLLGTQLAGKTGECVGIFTAENAVVERLGPLKAWHFSWALPISWTSSCSLKVVRRAAAVSSLRSRLANGVDRQPVLFSERGNGGTVPITSLAQYSREQYVASRGSSRKRTSCPPV